MNKSQSAHKRQLIICAIAILFSIVIFVDLILSRYGISVTRISVPNNSQINKLRIIQLTDLHNSEFGMNNQKLINQVSNQNPDLILITGDLLNSNEDNVGIATNLIKKLSDISDVYVSMGNHERDYTQRTGLDIKSIYINSGAIVLDEEYLDIEVNNQQLRIGGVFGYCLPQRYYKEKGFQQQQCRLLTEFQNTNKYKILMSHLPYAWWNYGFGNEWNVDLVLCGHTHGGQIILPFIGGVYDGETGWFPGYIAGYKHDGTDIVVSSGLGNTEFVPRFNNIPEIVVIDIE